MAVATKTRGKTVNRRRTLVPKRWRSILCDIPGYDPFRDAEDCWFDAATAEYYIEFIETCCTHIEGPLAGTPFLLERWEKAIVANLFGWMRKDSLGRTTRRYRRCLIYVPRKNGKCLALDTPLPTPTGWVTMADVRVGDKLFDEFGEPCTVLAAHPVLFDHRCYRMTFSDGTSIIADAEHLWRTNTRKPEGRTQTWTTEQIAATLTVGNRLTHRERNHSIPVALPLETDACVLPVAPYVLGAWLGDGDSDAARITCGDSDTAVMDAIQASGVSVGPARSNGGTASHRYRIGGAARGNRSGSLQRQLRGMGLLHDKRIPDAYLRASIAQRTELLQGLMDTDGYVSKAGQCEFTSIRPSLAKGMLELSRTLGMKPSVTIGRASCKGKDCGLKYRVQFWADHGIQPFKLHRKQARVRYPSETSRSRTRQIVSVEPVDSVPVRCVEVDSPSHLFLAGEGMVPTHNTPLTAAIHNAVFFLDNEAGQINNIAAASRDQASKLFRHIQGMIKAEPEMAKRCTPYATTRCLTKPDNSVTKVIPADENVAHGDNPHFQAIDELHAQPNAKLYNALSSAMVSMNRLQPLLLMLTTADYDRPSVCNDEYNYACKVRDGIVSDASYLPVIYEAMHKDAHGRPVEDDWKHQDTWIKANPNIGVSVSLEELRTLYKRAKEDISKENEFKRLHLNIRTQQDQRVISMDVWDACQGDIDWSTFAGRQCWAALDIGALRDFVSLVIGFPGETGEPVTLEIEDLKGEKKEIAFTRRDYWLRHFCWLPEQPPTRDPRMEAQIDAWSSRGHIIRTPGNVVDYDQVGADIARLTKPYGVVSLAIDQGFQGMQITQDLQRIFGEGRIIAFRQGILSMAAPFRELMQLLLLGRLHHDGDPVLRWMASNVAAETRGGLIKPSKDRSPEKIDGITAATMMIGIAMTTAAPKTSVYEEEGTRLWV